MVVDAFDVFPTLRTGDGGVVVQSHDAREVFLTARERLPLGLAEDVPRGVASFARQGFRPAVEGDATGRGKTHDAGHDHRRGHEP